MTSLTTADELRATVPIAEQIYMALKKDIMSGSLVPDKILTEVSVAEEYQASRTPAREALRRLESEHLLTMIPRRGYRRTIIEKSDLTHLFDAAAATESMAAALAAINRSDEQLEKILTLAAKSTPSTLKNENDVRQYFSDQYQFHLTVAEASGNAYLQEFIRSIQDRLLLYDVLLINYEDYIGGSVPLKTVTHMRIAEAIEARDSELASVLMRKHFQLNKQNVISE